MSRPPCEIPRPPCDGAPPNPVPPISATVRTGATARSSAATARSRSPSLWRSSPRYRSAQARSSRNSNGRAADVADAG